MYLLFALLCFEVIYEIPPLIPFSINKCISMSDIGSSSICIILSIASQLNPGKLK